MNPENKEMNDMGVFLNDDILKLALERIRAEEPDYLLELSLEGNDAVFAVSRNKNDLLSLGQLIHNTITYYVGVPK